MKILPILMISSMFTGLCAGTLPEGFKFGSADGNKRTSIVSQFKAYEEEQIKNADAGQGKASLKQGAPATTEAFDLIEEHKTEQVSFIEKCRQLIAQFIAYVSAKKE